jgi:hypothetical protein
MSNLAYKTVCQSFGVEPGKLSSYIKDLKVQISTLHKQREILLLKLASHESSEPKFRVGQIVVRKFYDIEVPFILRRYKFLGGKHYYSHIAEPYPVCNFDWIEETDLRTIKLSEIQ